jgi:hypothetical protein
MLAAESTMSYKLPGWLRWQQMRWLPEADKTAEAAAASRAEESKEKHSFVGFRRVTSFEKLSLRGESGRTLDQLWQPLYLRNITRNKSVPPLTT